MLPPMTKEDAIKFLKAMGLKDHRYIGGQEREHLLTVFRLIEPTSSSNNQRTWTDTYHHAGKEYHVTYGFGVDGGDEPLVEEIKEL